jgi:hypothetical protein
LAAGSSSTKTDRFQEEMMADLEDEKNDIEWMREHDEQLLGGARNEILRTIAEHERRIHGGGCCLSERINVIAFMAHSLGLRANADETWTYIRTILEAVYEAHHH